MINSINANPDTMNKINSADKNYLRKTELNITDSTPKSSLVKAAMTNPLDCRYLHKYFDFSLNDANLTSDKKLGDTNLVAILVENDVNMKNKDESKDYSSTIRFNLKNKNKDVDYSFVYPVKDVKQEKTDYGFVLKMGDSSYELHSKDNVNIDYIKLNVNFENKLVLDAILTPQVQGFNFGNDGVCSSTADGKKVFGGTIIAPYSLADVSLKFNGEKYCWKNAEAYHDQTLGSILSVKDEFWTKSTDKEVISIARVINQPNFNKMGNFFQYFFRYNKETKERTITSDFDYEVMEYSDKKKIIPKKINVALGNDSFNIEVKEELESMSGYVRSKASINGRDATCERMNIPSGCILNNLAKIVLISQIKKNIKETKEFFSKMPNVV
jgi:hypothetical protein